MNDIPIVEDLVQKNIHLYDIDFDDGGMVAELARISVGRLSNTVWLLRYNSHICYVSAINVPFKAYRCPSCDQFEAGNLERHWTTCMEQVKQISLKKVHHLRETLFDKLGSFGIPCTDNQNFFNNMAIFKSESIYVENEIFKDIETTKWIEKHIPLLYRYRATWYKNPFSSSIAILVILYHLSFLLRRIWLRKVKLKLKWTSFNLEPQ